MKSIFVCASALSMAALVSPAFAGKSKSQPAPVDYAADGLKEMRQLNLIVLGDMTGGDDVEGKTFVGGNLSNAATFGKGRSGQNPVGTPVFPTLTVVGNLFGTANIEGVVSKSGSVTVGGNAGTVDLNGSKPTLLVGGSVGSTNGAAGATIEAGAGLGMGSHTGTTVEGNLGPTFSTPLVSGLQNETATMIANLDALSTVLAALPSTGTFNGKDPNNASFTSINKNNIGYSVIDITAAQYESASNFLYNITIPTIINVSGGGSIVDNANSNGSAANDNDILWNFEGATNISFNRQVDGSVLAPYATISNASPINGTLAAMGLKQGGELHQFAFKSSLVGAIGAATPEPATWAMMLVGFGLAGAVLRRRRVTVAA